MKAAIPNKTKHIPRRVYPQLETMIPQKAEVVLSRTLQLTFVTGFGKQQSNTRKVGLRYLFAVSAVVPVVGVESRPRRNGEQHFLLRGVRSGEPDVSERKFRRDRDRVPRRVASIVSRRRDSPKPLPFTLSLVSVLQVV